MSSSCYKQMSSERGRGTVGRRRNELAPCPVAPIIYRGYAIACSICCRLSTPSSICILRDARTPHAIPSPVVVAYQEWFKKECPASLAKILPMSDASSFRPDVGYVVFTSCAS